MSKVVTATTLADLSSAAGAGNAVAYFWASWAPMCSQTEQIFQRLSEQCQNLAFVKIEAEAAEDLTEKFGVSSVPAFVFLKGGLKVDMLVGANAPEITGKIAQFHQSCSSGQKGCGAGSCGGGGCGGGGCGSGGCNKSTACADPVPQPDTLETKLEKLINREPVMLFMKGSPAAEKCGFSRQIVTLLQENGVKFGSFDILTDEEVRQGLKTYSKWPTYPQLYSKGKLIGGLDILKELIENGELNDALGLVGEKEGLNSRLEKLINREPVMLFMVGSPSAEKCGFSRQIVAVLKEHGVKFGYFDILTDDEVWQGLKTYSNWPTYPQLYCKGKLIGGLDIVKELAENGELKQAVGM